MTRIGIISSCIFLIGALTAQGERVYDFRYVWDEPFPFGVPEAIEALHDDNIVGNATSAHAFLRHLRDSNDAQWTVAEQMLHRTLVGQDRQARIFAALLLDGDVSDARAAAIVDGLSDDDVNSNGLLAYALLKKARRDKPDLWNRVEPLLKTALTSPDHQKRTYAAILIEDDASQARIEVLLESLEHDNFRWTGHRVSNAQKAIYFLSKLGKAVPYDSLLERHGRDSQSDYGRLMLIASIYPEKLSQDQIMEIGFHLRSDIVDRNALTAYAVLKNIDEAQFRSYLANHDPDDWQEMAFLRMLAIHHGIDWCPDFKSMLERFNPSNILTIELFFTTCRLSRSCMSPDEWNKIKAIEPRFGQSTGFASFRRWERSLEDYLRGISTNEIQNIGHL